MPGVTVTAGAHSANKDHTAMTGGTFLPDKLVVSNTGNPLRLHQFFLPLVSLSGEDPRIFAGVHSIEHALAFSPETGSMRHSLVHVTEDPEMGSQLIDVSPYMIDLGNIRTARNTRRVTHEPFFGFRATYISSDGRGPSKQSILAAYVGSLETMGAYYDSGGEAPFSTPESCGQYDMHSPEAALELIRQALDRRQGLHVTGGKAQQTGAMALSVCDLRLVAPRAENSPDQRVLGLFAAHSLSQHLEHNAWVNLPWTGTSNSMKFGTFGCSTGAYVALAHPDNTTDSRPDLYHSAHVAITRSLFAVAFDTTAKDPQSLQASSDAALSLLHVEQFSPQVYQEATAA